MKTIEKYKEDLMYYQVEDFKVKHLFTSRIGWDQEDIFKDLSRALDIPEDKIYRGKQVHGTEILVVKNQNYEDVLSKEKDGFITNIKGVALATYHADCVPIFFYDRKKEVIGLAHSGWKGTLNNISKPIVEGMKEGFDSKMEDIYVAIGPSIGVCCYEVQEDLVELFSRKYDKNIIANMDGKTYLDLWKINRINLIELGIKEENIHSSELCTACNIDKLYSYRKEKGTKNRMLAAIALS